MVCDDSQGIGAVLISPSGGIFEFSNLSKEDCTNKQVEYEAILFGLEFLQFMGVKRVKAFGGATCIQRMLMIQWIFKCIS